ncbi:BQ5605_C082g12985 [Microbotryum silenes-dioicae]|uniref:Cytochrome b n=1 Tax=Microbotryum silenes-dioicae TaxID=796604 RepID=A0A2X0P0T8_9BASI|nr:BQ5605_C082g12985 [Microbotryum silenes-dioicae]
MHLLALHEHGSSNPLGVSGNTDRLPFHPYFTFKDLVTVFLFLLVLSVMVFYAPNYLGHSDNYIPANPMQTPPSIKYTIDLPALFYFSFCKNKKS